MSIKASKDLVKGTTPMLVLSVLRNEDMYGYKIIRELEKQSEYVFSMKEGTLYPVLHALEIENCLESYWDEFEGRKRKYYHITKKGLACLKEKQQEWKSVSAAVDRVLNLEIKPAGI